ncbi:hypothetical protein FIBSPDRAFT_952279 [Athelia psychrophila]|uniref:Uncharacterized protein n=1 Tax=Athelia psychrophila TaxID=1759441 RepID=A0A166LQK6_9AGAM|nr:hypothetical protein FIBSPDRAFT_952279 [Fibularhizoctonia sp. CBS 109695]
MVILHKMNSPAQVPDVNTTARSFTPARASDNSELVAETLQYFLHAEAVIFSIQLSMHWHYQMTVNQYYRNSLPLPPSLSRDLASMCEAVDSDLLTGMDEVISNIDDVTLHLAKIKFDLMNEHLLIGRRGIISAHEKERWTAARNIIFGLHLTIAQGKWGPREWAQSYSPALPMCRGDQ